MSLRATARGWLVGLPGQLLGNTSLERNASPRAVIELLESLFWYASAQLSAD